MSRAHYRLPISGLLVAALFLINLEAGMALDRTITFFSEINALLVDEDGIPLGGVRIERSWRRSPEDEPIVDETVTDPTGVFSLPAVTGRRTVFARLPGTPVIRQEITAFGPDGPVTLWKAVKTNFDANGELHGRPLNLECRIDVEPDGDGPAWGTCREANEPIAAAVAASGEVLTPGWEWPAGRPVEIRLLVRLEIVEPARTGFLGIGNSPSLTGSMPDPYEIAGTVVHGPAEFQGRSLSLRVPGAEAAGLAVGGVAALGLVEQGRVCICVAPDIDGCSRERTEVR